jgi:RNA polymerase sigma-70 factor (ECF subfamily)
MTAPPTTLLRELFLPETATASAPAASCEIEAEVMGLFEQFRLPILRYCISFGLSVHVGEEISQEVFLALFRHLRMGRSRRNLRGWIFRVAHNLAVKQCHANQRSPRMAELDATISERHSDPSPNPEERFDFAQRHSRLRAVLQALPEQDRRCLRLRSEGLRYREISHVLGMSLGSVSVSLTRSLARLMAAVDR